MGNIILTLPKYYSSMDIAFRRIVVKFVQKLLITKKAATAIEYGLIAALIAIVAVTAMTKVGGRVSTTFNNVSSNLKAT